MLVLKNILFVKHTNIKSWQKRGSKGNQQIVLNRRIDGEDSD